MKRLFFDRKQTLNGEYFNNWELKSILKIWRKTWKSTLKIEAVYFRRVPSVQHISSTQKGHFFLAPKIPQFHIENQSVQETPQFYTKKPSVPHQKLQFHTPLSSSWSGNEGCVELEGFWCETEEVLVLNWGGFDMELRDIRC